MEPLYRTEDLIVEQLVGEPLKDTVDDDLVRNPSTDLYCILYYDIIR
jgi:hypothetical protein